LGEQAFLRKQGQVMNLPLDGDGLRREIGLFSTTVLVIANIIGTGFLSQRILMSIIINL
jgi:hypothetical protein